MYLPPMLKAGARKIELESPIFPLKLVATTPLEQVGWSDAYDREALSGVWTFGARCTNLQLVPILTVIRSAWDL